MNDKQIYIRNYINTSMKKQISLSLIAIIAISTIQAVNAQSDEGPLRAVPKIEEDQFIICSKDVSNERYFGQLSCIVVNSDDVLSQQQADKLYKQTQSLEDTFEMGLVD